MSAKEVIMSAKEVVMSAKELKCVSYILKD